MRADAQRVCRRTFSFHKWGVSSRESCDVLLTETEQPLVTITGATVRGRISIFHSEVWRRAALLAPVWVYAILPYKYFTQYDSFTYGLRMLPFQVFYCCIGYLVMLIDSSCVLSFFSITHGDIGRLVCCSSQSQCFQTYGLGSTENPHNKSVRSHD